MKKIVSGLILVSLLLVPVVAFGDTPPPPKDGDGGSSSGEQTTDMTAAPELNVIPTLGRIIDVVFTILLVFAALMIIIAAYQFITAGGDAGKVGEARNKVMWALVGVVLAFLARGMIAFIEAFLEPQIINSIRIFIG